MNPSTSEGLSTLIAALWMALALACSSLPSHPEIDEEADHFSARRARAHYAALAGLGPRPSGSEAAKRARGYVARELRWAGAELEPTVPDPESAGHLVAALPGTSPDRVWVVAPWAASGSSADLDDTGVATLLELARALGRRRAPYSVVLVAAAVSPPEHPDSDASGAEKRAAVRASGTDLVEMIVATEGFEGLRAVLVLEPRADPSGAIARDLRSHPVFRDLFWRAASRLGHGDTFPEDGAWATPEGIQGAFLSAGYGRVLSLVDAGAGRPVSGALPTDPRERALPEPDRFEPVGAVAFEGLLQLMGRFSQVDAFSN